MKDPIKICHGWHNINATAFTYYVRACHSAKDLNTPQNYVCVLQMCTHVDMHSWTEKAFRSNPKWEALIQPLDIWTSSSLNLDLSTLVVSSTWLDWPARGSLGLKWAAWPMLTPVSSTLCEIFYFFLLRYHHDPDLLHDHIYITH